MISEELMLIACVWRWEKKKLKHPMFIEEL